MYFSYCSLLGYKIFERIDYVSGITAPELLYKRKLRWQLCQKGGDGGGAVGKTAEFAYHVYFTQIMYICGGLVGAGGSHDRALSPFKSPFIIWTVSYFFSFTYSIADISVSTILFIDLLKYYYLHYISTWEPLIFLSSFTRFLSSFIPPSFVPFFLFFCSFLLSFSIKYKMDSLEFETQPELVPQLCH